MLTLKIDAIELFNEESNEFMSSKEQTLQLEHSLVSISKWEAKWEKPFLSKDSKTKEQVIDYIKCMTLTQNVNSNVYLALSDKNFQEVNNYIEAPMTATILPEEPKSGGREKVTAELIYYWMIAFEIPFECQKWHLNRLLTLINVCNYKNNPKKKFSNRELLERNRDLNNARKAQLNTRG